MAGRLKNSVSISTLARDLGIAGSKDSIAAIIKFCERRVKKVLETFPDCHTLTELLDCVAAKLGTVFEIVTSDEDLRQIQRKYVLKSEKIFADIGSGAVGGCLCHHIQAYPARALGTRVRFCNRFSRVKGVPCLFYEMA